MLTVVLVVATAGASPVVSAFLALVFAGLGVDVERRHAALRFALLGVLAVLPVLVDRRALPAGRHVPVPLAGARGDAGRLSSASVSSSRRSYRLVRVDRGVVRARVRRSRSSSRRRSAPT